MRQLRIHKERSGRPDCLWLRNHTNYNKLARYNHPQNTLEIFEATEPPAFTGHTVGFFEILSGKIIGFYRLQNQLYLLLDGKNFLWNNTITVGLIPYIDQRILLINQCEKELLHCEYSIDTTQIFKNDPTAFVEPEHFDFGLFVLNLNNNPARRTSLAMSCSEYQP